MKENLITIFQAVRLSQERLIAFLEADDAGPTLPRTVLGELCGILGDDALIAAMLELSAVLEEDSENGSISVAKH